MPGATFSRTLKCWYVPKSAGIIDAILKAFKDVAWVDLKQLNRSQAEKKGVLPEKTELRKTTGQAEGLHDVQRQALQKMEHKLKLRGYSTNTQRTYLQHFKEFLQFYYDSHPTDLGEMEIRNYLLYLIDRCKLSKSTQNTAINAIKFFYEKVLEQERRVYHLERPMKDKRLPEVLSQEEVLTLES